MKTGVFMDGSVSGVFYETDSYRDEIDEYGKFKYEDGEIITFSIGGLTLGSCAAKPVVTTLDFVPESAGRKLLSVTNPVVTNMARLLLSIGRITLKEDLVLAKYRYDINFCMDPEKFGESDAIKNCIKEIGTELISIEKTHNITRRSVKGICKETDVKIPVNRGHYVLADIYRPLEDGKYPVIISMGAFGKSFINGFALTKEDEQFFETVEDQFYESYGDKNTRELLQSAFFKRFAQNKGINPEIPNLAKDGDTAGNDDSVFSGPVSSVFEQAAADDWVPYGYAVINIEEYGVGKNRGELKQFGSGNAKDLCDAIKWASEQSWSTGKVGLFGASYFAMTQYLAAQRHPKGLTAMIAIMGDYDSYRHYVYSGGGLLNIFDNADLNIYPQEKTFMSEAIENPFWSEEIYGTEAEFMSSADIKKIDYPIWSVVEPDASLHGLGSSEAYINCSSKEKKLTLLNGSGIHFWMYSEEFLSKFRAFFDHYLKGIENGIMSEAPVEIQIRSGNGSYRLRHGSNWPVPGTIYRKYYLDMSSDGLIEHEPFGSGEISYNADVRRREDDRVVGASFVTEPFKEDTEIAGYIKAGLYVSSNTSDMELHLNVRVLDENGREVKYTAFLSNDKKLPLGFGSLKVSHRELDPELSRTDYPVHKHTKEAYKPLNPGEIVYCEIGTFPTSGLIKKGWRLLLEISPISNRWVDYNEESYRKGSVNTIYCGPNTMSYLQLPVLPKNNE
jgi:predicted acyl esterase